MCKRQIEEEREGRRARRGVLVVEVDSLLLVLVIVDVEVGQEQREKRREDRKPNKIEGGMRITKMRKVT